MAETTDPSTSHREIPSRYPVCINCKTRPSDYHIRKMSGSRLQLVCISCQHEWLKFANLFDFLGEEESINYDAIGNEPETIMGSYRKEDWRKGNEELHWHHNY